MSGGGPPSLSRLRTVRRSPASCRSPELFGRFDAHGRFRRVFLNDLARPFVGKRVHVVMIDQGSSEFALPVDIGA